MTCRSSRNVFKLITSDVNICKEFSTSRELTQLRQLGSCGSAASSLMGSEAEITLVLTINIIFIDKKDVFCQLIVDLN